MIVLNKQTQTQTQTLSPNLFYLEKRNQEELVSSDILLPVNLNIIIHAINFDTIENMNKKQCCPLTSNMEPFFIIPILHALIFSEFRTGILIFNRGGDILN